MLHVESGRLTGLVLSVALVAGIGCSHPEREANVNGPTVPSPEPSPVPSPSPSPSPSPNPPSRSTTGIIVEVVQWGSQECKRGIHPAPDGLRVGCGVEVRALREDEHGSKVPEKRTGNATEWRLAEGAENATLPWDENTWRRWLTGVAPGHYRILMTLTLKDGEKVSAQLEGEIVP